MSRAAPSKPRSPSSRRTCVCTSPRATMDSPRDPSRPRTIPWSAFRRSDVGASSTRHPLASSCHAAVRSRISRFPTGSSPGGGDAASSARAAAAGRLEEPSADRTIETAGRVTVTVPEAPPHSAAHGSSTRRSSMVRNGAAPRPSAAKRKFVAETRKGARSRSTRPTAPTMPYRRWSQERAWSSSSVRGAGVSSTMPMSAPNAAATIAMATRRRDQRFRRISLRDSRQATGTGKRPGRFRTPRRAPVVIAPGLRDGGSN